MPRIHATLILCLSGTLLLTACQHGNTVKPASVTKVIPIEKIAPEETVPKKDVSQKKNDTTKTLENIEKKFSDVKKKEPPEKPIEIAVIVSYFRFLNSLPEKALKQEHARTQKEFAANQSPINRLRLAMLLGFTNTKHRDTQRSLDLLNSYMKNPDSQDPMLRDFSFLLASFVQQFKKQDQTYEKVRQQLHKERTKNKKLNKMIEDLKTIETNIMKRDTREKQ